MTNEELKKKICEIIAPYVSAWGEDERIADVLIAAGYGDVKEAEHRAERAERALYKASKDIKDICEYIVKIGGTGVITIKNYAPERAEPSAYIDRAEKELAEERKDGIKTD